MVDVDDGCEFSSLWFPCPLPLKLSDSDFAWSLAEGAMEEAAPSEKELWIWSGDLRVNR